MVHGDKFSPTAKLAPSPSWIRERISNKKGWNGRNERILGSRKEGRGRGLGGKGNKRVDGQK